MTDSSVRGEGHLPGVREGWDGKGGVRDTGIRRAAGLSGGDTEDLAGAGQA